MLCLTLCNPMDCMEPSRFLCPWDFLGKNTAVACHSHLQGIFPIYGSNLQLADSLPLSHLGSPRVTSDSNKSNFFLLSVFSVFLVVLIKQGGVGK